MTITSEILPLDTFCPFYLRMLKLRSLDAVSYCQTCIFVFSNAIKWFFSDLAIIVYRTVTVWSRVENPMHSCTSLFLGVGGVGVLYGWCWGRWSGVVVR